MPSELMRAFNAFASQTKNIGFGLDGEMAWEVLKTQIVALNDEIDEKIHAATQDAENYKVGFVRVMNERDDLRNAILELRKIAWEADPIVVSGELIDQMMNMIDNLNLLPVEPILPPYEG